MFQPKLQEGIKTVKQSKNVFISADKATNIYIMEKDDCNRYHKENITKICKKKETDTSKVNSINCKAIKIVEKLSVDDRVEKMQENEPFITMKDHRGGFPQNTSCSYSNPSNTNIGNTERYY